MNKPIDVEARIAEIMHRPVSYIPSGIEDAQNNLQVLARELAAESEQMREERVKYRCVAVQEATEGDVARAKIAAMLEALRPWDGDPGDDHVRYQRLKAIAEGQKDD